MQLAHPAGQLEFVMRRSKAHDCARNLEESVPVAEELISRPWPERCDMIVVCLTVA